jgi:uncharacterized delta-60 repeat protein
VAGTTGSSGPLSQTDFAIARLNPDGSPDSTFGSGGQVTVDFNGRRDTALWVIPYLDSSNEETILVGGSAEENPSTGCFPSCNTNIALVRLKDDGSLDAGFGTSGKAEIDLGASEVSTAAIQIDRQTIAVVGSRIATASEYVMAEICENGSLNPNFGSNGVITGTVPSTLAGVAQIYSNGNNDLVAVGSAGNDMGLIRVDHLGNLVSSFGTGGVQVQDLGGVDAAKAVLVLPDGTLLVGGNSDASLALARFTANGQLVPGNLALTDLGDVGAETARAFSVQYDRDVRLWITGGLRAGADNRLAMARFFYDFSADAGGRQVTDFASPGADPTYYSRDQAYESAFQTDGKLVVVGRSQSGNTLAGALARYNRDGTLDTTFGVGGRVIITSTTSFDSFVDVQVQPDNKIVVADNRFNVARLNPDGSPDLSFGVDGWARADFTGAFSYALAIQEDGKLVVAGGQQGIAQLDTIALARFDANGVLDPGFGLGGKLRTGIGLNAGGLDVAIQPDGKLLVAGVTFVDEANLASHDFALVRYDSDGSLDASFGNGGKVATDFGAYEIAYAIAVQPNGKIVIGGESLPGSLAFARYNPGGALDTTFGADGKLIIPSADDGERVTDLALDGDWLVATTCDPVLNTGTVIRLTPAGKLDASFNGNGRATFKFAGADCPMSVAVSNGRIAAAGYAGFAGGWQDFAVAMYQSGIHSLYLPLALR